MQNSSHSLVNILSSSTRDFVPVDLIEFYDPSTTELVPGLAVKRFANTALVWYGWEYEQQAVSRGSTARYIDERFNTVSLTFSNVDRSLSEWLSSVSLAGYRVLIRAVSRSVSGDSIVLFIGRVEKAFSVTNTSVSLTIKQDLGSINSELPARKFSHACPLKFKGKDCLGGQAITAKTQRYQNATTCDKSWQQCRTYGNSIFFQGFRTTNVTGSFVLRDRSSVGIPTKSTKQWSSQDATPINEHVPMGLGRTQIELTPIASADTGQFVYGHWVAGEGPITKFRNARNVTPGFAKRFEGQAENGEPSGGGSYREHLGNYGNVAGQQSASNFLGEVHYSGRAYIEGTIRGQNPDTGDPAPSIVSTVLWNPIPTAQASTTYDDANPDWSDNPVDHVRYILTHERGLQYPVEMVNDEVAIETAKYCDDPLYDKSGGEDLVVGQTDDVLYGSFTAGRFRSTGLIDPFFWRRRLNSSAPYSAERSANITYFPVVETVTDQFGQQVEQLVPPPINLVPNEYFRKRFTANWHLKKGVKVADFLFKQLLPSFQGYLVTGADGRLQIRSQRSAVQSRSSGTVTPAMNTIDVYDGKQFIDLNLPVKYVLIQSPGLPASGNVRQVVGIDYLTAANAITIGPPSSGASGMNCRIWGANPNTQAATTFSGGSTQYQAFAYILVTDGLLQNDTAGVRIDGVDVGAGGPIGNTSGYSGNWSAEIAAMIATNLNANPNLRNALGIPLRDYIEAIWEPSNPLMVLFRSKQATLILDRPFDTTFLINALVTHFHLPFSDGSDGRPSTILKDSFEWPLGGRQSTYNQFSITYQDSVQDSQSINVLENDYDHQETTNQINKMDVPGGECVDNYHQADRLLLAARYKYREGDFFVQFQTAGLAMLLEEGDLILVNHSSMRSFQNYLYRIEELNISQDHRVTITARLYADTQYPEQPLPKTIPLTRSNDWQTAVVPPVRSFSIERVPNTGNVARVTIETPLTVAPTSIRVLVRRFDDLSSPPGFVDSDFIDTGIVLPPSTENLIQFEIPGIGTGSQIQFVPVTSTGIEGESSTFTVPTLPLDSGGSNAREMLTGDRTYYVRTDGNDTNTGLGNTASTAFLTLQGAYNRIVSRIDTSGYTVTVKVANGTYTGGLLVDKQWAGGGQIKYVGDTTTPANVKITTTSASCFNITASLPSQLTIEGFELSTVTSGHAIILQASGAKLILGTNRFSTTAQTHMTARDGGVIEIQSNYSIIGSASRHYNAIAAGIISMGAVTVSVFNTPNFASTFTYADEGGIVRTVFTNYQITGGGTTNATGSRFIVQNLSLISTFGSTAATYYPGNALGTETTATFGKYT